MDIIKMKKGTVIFREGDQENWMYDLFAGSVDVYVNYGTEEQKKLAILEAGELFGEMGLVENAPRSATVVAAEDIQLEKITEENFKEYLQERPVKVLRIMQQTSDRMRELSRNYVGACGLISTYLDNEAKGKKQPKELVESMKNLLKKNK